MTVVNRRNANSQEAWDALWAAENVDTWRQYPVMFGRVAQLVPEGSKVFDLGCGVGVLLDRLRDERGCVTSGADISPVATALAREKGHDVDTRNIIHAPHLFAPGIITPNGRHVAPDADVIVATEMLEHLPLGTIEVLLGNLAAHEKQFICAVPNNCLGPDVEPQHHHQWTALEFLTLLRRFFPDARVECVHDGCPRLIGVCGFPRPYRLAVTFPAKNEGADIERVLSSFRGVADVIVVAVDDTTTDETAEIAKRYAEDVRPYTWEKSFCKARNICVDRCKEHNIGENDWIFMTEGHEALSAGTDALVDLGWVPNGISVLEVERESDNALWMFPWLFRARPGTHWEKDVHNRLIHDEDEGQAAQLYGVATLHDRHQDNADMRVQQRAVINRRHFQLDLMANSYDTRALYYLGTEWAAKERFDKAIELFERYMSIPGTVNKNKIERYQVRLYLARWWWHRATQRLKAAGPDDEEANKAARKDLDRAYDLLMGACVDDFSRVEHWIMAGDLCYSFYERSKSGGGLQLLERARVCYEYAVTGIGRRPHSYFWVEKAAYQQWPAQKLAGVYAGLGFFEEAAYWCRRYIELLPPNSPAEAVEEAKTVLAQIEDKLHEQGARDRLRGGPREPDQSRNQAEAGRRADRGNGDARAG